MKIKEAKLETKNRQVILDACDDLLQISIAAINKHKEDLRRKAEAGEQVRLIARRPAARLKLQADHLSLFDAV